MTGDELRALRVAAGLTQRQLADLADVTTTTISRWERGERAIGTLAARGLRASINEHRSPTLNRRNA